jgi:hypothetical protein
MNRLLLTCIVSVALVTGCADPADDVVAGEATFELGSSRLDVAFAGYRGELRSQGIEGYQTFCNQFRWGQLKAQTIANAAANLGLISAREAGDASYVWQLKQEVDSLCR